MWRLIGSKAVLGQRQRPSALPWVLVVLQSDRDRGVAFVRRMDHRAWSLSWAGAGFFPVSLGVGARPVAHAGSQLVFDLLIRLG
jgi:hypothetical protein